MENLILQHKDAIDIIIQLLVLIFIIVGLLTLKFQKKEVHFSTVKKCIDDHRNILRKQQTYIPNENETVNENELCILVKDHLGLINEELFYMKNGYLPKELSLDWLKDMILFVPIYIEAKKGEPINEEDIKNSKEISQYINCSDLNNSNYDKYIQTASESFGRIKKVFSLDDKFYKRIKGVNKKVDFKDEKTREKIAKYLWNKLKKE